MIDHPTPTEELLGKALESLDTIYNHKPHPNLIVILAGDHLCRLLNEIEPLVDATDPQVAWIVRTMVANAAAIAAGLNVLDETLGTPPCCPQE